MAAQQALGMIETKGLVASIEAADAMVKARTCRRRTCNRNGKRRRRSCKSSYRCRSSRSRESRGADLHPCNPKTS